MSADVKKMYFLVRDHDTKTEVSDEITEYRELMVELNALGAIEPDWYEGKV